MRGSVIKFFDSSFCSICASFRLGGRGRVVDGVIVADLRLKAAVLPLQHPRTAVAEEAVVADKLHLVVTVAEPDAIDADRVPIGRLARYATEKCKIA